MEAACTCSFCSELTRSMRKLEMWLSEECKWNLAQGQYCMQVQQEMQRDKDLWERKEMKLCENLNELNLEIESLRKTIQDQQKEKVHLEYKNEVLEDQKQELKDKMETIQDKVKNLCADLSKTQYRARVLEEKLTIISKSREEAQMFKARLSQLEFKRVRLETKVNKLQEEKRELHAELNHMRDRNCHLELKLMEMQEKLSRFNNVTWQFQANQTPQKKSVNSLVAFRENDCTMHEHECVKYNEVEVKGSPEINKGTFKNNCIVKWQQQNDFLNGDGTAIHNVTEICRATPLEVANNVQEYDGVTIQFKEEIIFTDKEQNEIQTFSHAQAKDKKKEAHSTSSCEEKESETPSIQQKCLYCDSCKSQSKLLMQPSVTKIGQCSNVAPGEIRTNKNKHSKTKLINICPSDEIYSIGADAATSVSRSDSSEILEGKCSESDAGCRKCEPQQATVTENEGDNMVEENASSNCKACNVENPYFQKSFKKKSQRVFASNRNRGSLSILNKKSDNRRNSNLLYRKHIQQYSKNIQTEDETMLTENVIVKYRVGNENSMSSQQCNKDVQTEHRIQSTASCTCNVLDKNTIYEDNTQQSNEDIQSLNRNQLIMLHTKNSNLDKNLVHKKNVQHSKYIQTENETMLTENAILKNETNIEGSLSYEGAFHCADGLNKNRQNIATTDKINETVNNDTVNKQNVEQCKEDIHYENLIHSCDLNKNSRIEDDELVYKNAIPNDNKHIENENVVQPINLKIMNNPPHNDLVQGKNVSQNSKNIHPIVLKENNVASNDLICENNKHIKNEIWPIDTKNINRDIVNDHTLKKNKQQDKKTGVHIVNNDAVNKNIIQTENGIQPTNLNKNKNVINENLMHEGNKNKRSENGVHPFILKKNNTVHNDDISKKNVQSEKRMQSIDINKNKNFINNNHMHKDVLINNEGDPILLDENYNINDELAHTKTVQTANQAQPTDLNKNNYTGINVIVPENNTLQWNETVKTKHEIQPITMNENNVVIDNDVTHERDTPQYEEHDQNENETCHIALCNAKTSANNDLMNQNSTSQWDENIPDANGIIKLDTMGRKNILESDENMQIINEIEPSGFNKNKDIWDNDLHVLQCSSNHNVWSENRIQLNTMSGDEINVDRYRPHTLNKSNNVPIHKNSTLLLYENIHGEYDIQPNDLSKMNKVVVNDVEHEAKNMHLSNYNSSSVESKRNDISDSSIKERNTCANGNYLWTSPSENLALVEAAKEGHFSNVEELLSLGACPNCDYNGDTALHVAAEAGNLKVCRLLLEAGARVDAKNNFSSTPLHAAARYGNLEVAKLLMKWGASKEHRDRASNLPFNIAINNGHFHMYNVLQI